LLSFTHPLTHTCLLSLHHPPPHPKRLSLYLSLSVYANHHHHSATLTSLPPSLKVDNDDDSLPLGVMFSLCMTTSMPCAQLARSRRVFDTFGRILFSITFLVFGLQ